MDAVHRQLAVSLPPGPIGLFTRPENGTCVVSRLDNNDNASAHSPPPPLRVGDVIVSMNGIRMAEVEGGASGAWAALLSAFETVARNLIVLRRDGAGATTTTGNDVTSTTTTSNNDAAGRMTNNDAVVKKMRATKHAPLRDSTRHNSAKRPRVVRHHDAEKAPGLGESSSRNGGARSGIEVISLLDCDSDVGDEDVPSDKDDGGASLAVAATRSRNNSGINIEEDDPDDDDKDDDVMLVSTSSASSQWMQASSSLSSSSLGNLKDDRNYGTENFDLTDKDELTIVATKGKNALADFPHSRENCATHPFTNGGDNTMHCSNCYCYVCDTPSSDCMTWASHCMAFHKDPRWRAERARAKRGARERPPAPPTPSTRAVAAVPGAIAHSRHPSPASSVRHTSLQTMAQKTSSGSLSSSNRNADYSVRKLLERMTTVHPVEMQPPADSGFVTPLRHYQRQSLAFMVDTERTASRGGWLCDEVGMGKVRLCDSSFACRFYEKYSAA
jgi:hypothetical protein